MGQPQEVLVFSEVVLRFKDEGAVEDKIKVHRQSLLLIQTAGASTVVMVREGAGHGSIFYYHWEEVESVEAVPARVAAVASAPVGSGPVAS